MFDPSLVHFPSSSIRLFDHLKYKEYNLLPKTITFLCKLPLHFKCCYVRVIFFMSSKSCKAGTTVFDFEFKLIHAEIVRSSVPSVFPFFSFWVVRTFFPYLLATYPSSFSHLHLKFIDKENRFLQCKCTQTNILYYQLFLIIIYLCPQFVEY